MASSHNDKDDTTSQRKNSRGSSRLKDHIRMRDQGIKIEVHFNSRGQPIGEASKKMASWIGVVVRQRVPIDIADWRQVTKELKESIWTEIKSIYIVPENKKKDILVTAGTQWKQFKNALTTKYIRKGLIEAPPEDYPWIEPQVWKNFVQYRTSKEFQELSAKNKEIHESVNKYPHLMSRRGYARTENDLIKKRSSESGEEVSTIDRSELWSLGRKKSDGSYITDDARDIAGRIDSLSQLASQGDIHSSGMDDILSMAMGTQDHPGRVRGVGQGVGIKKYFKKTRRQHDKDFIESEVRKRVKIEMEKMQVWMDEQMRAMQEHIRQMNPPSQPSVYGTERQSPPQFSAADSCTVSHDLSSISMSCQRNRDVSATHESASES